MFKTLTYKTNKSLGNFEHESVELTYEFDGSRENVDEVYDIVRGKALELLGLDENNEEPPFEASAPKTVKKTASKPKPSR